MRKSISFKGWSIYAGISHSQRTKGVNSLLPNGKHFLMWDFDDVDAKELSATLAGIQYKYKLPRIFIVNTGREGYYHAYCFKAFSYPDTLRILADTDLLDKIYFRLGVIREYFTLRYVPKDGKDFMPAVVLCSKYKEDVNPYELVNFAEYWTKRVI